MSKKLISPAALSIAESFRTEQLGQCIIDGHGISRMSVKWRDHTVKLSWYAGERPRSLRIDDFTGFPQGYDTLYIFRAAWQRADKITSEMITRLDAEV